jgi:sugar transferase (PEP-CTERM system associated)
MLTCNYVKIPEHESFVKWFGVYIAFATLATFIVSLSIYHSIQGDAYAIYYKHMASYIAIIAFPFILVNLIYSLAQFKMNLTNITLKMVLSSSLSLTLLSATREVKPFSSEDVSIVLYALGVFTSIMLARDISRNVPMALPGLASRVLVVGNDGFLEEMQRLISTSDQRYQLAGTLRFPGRNETSPESQARDIFETAKSLKADKVAISLAERRGNFPLQEMLNCKLSGIEVLDAPGIYERITGKLLIEDINPSWFIFCHGFKITPWLTLAKRLVDIVSSVIGIGLSLSFMPLVMLAIKLDSPGPILFRQQRVGQGDKPFVLYKLRTMRQDAEQSTGAVWASKADPRVTRLGQLLRKSRIDEIPQLINVLKGEMSLVGPRPERPEFVRKLKEIIPYYSERHFVKPGVTGWAQVQYPYGASIEDALEKLRYDLYYIKNISLLLDLRIIFKTIGVVLLRKGAR